MSELEKALKAKVRGEVRFDPIAKRVYSVDASIYEIEPLGIVVPVDREDLIAAIRLCYQHKTPLIARGAATGIAGGCIGRGVIFDLSKHLNKVLEINVEEGYVRCEPGVIQDDLNRILSSYHRRLGPDTSTGNRATLGGMLANNAAGAYSLKYGTMVDHILEVDVILDDGTAVTLGEVSPQEWQRLHSVKGRLGEICRTAQKIKDEERDEILDKFPKLPRRASGYNLNTLLEGEVPNLAKLIAGSEGTLGVVAAMKLKLSELPLHTLLGIISYSTLHEALRQVPTILKSSPLSLEMIDKQIITMGRQSPQLRHRLHWLEGTPEALLIVEMEGENTEDCRHQFEKLKNVGEVKMLDAKDAKDVWAVRKAGLELLLSKRSYQRAVAFIEDVAVPPEHLPEFMEKLMPILAIAGSTAGIYGHVGAGCIHIRPYLNLRHASDLQKMAEISRKTVELVVSYRGAMSGEHGDGLVRSWLHKELFGTRITATFALLKKAFDPQGLMNPGKIVVKEETSFLEDLRSDPDTPQPAIQTFLNFDAEGGFTLAADLCNGNGLCRKKSGTMCPSFQVTGDELDTTRARAQALRGIVNGELPLSTLHSAELMEILDLCVECKGCRSECPASVDMAKMKAEALYHYQEKHGYLLRNKLFGRIARHLQSASHFPDLANKVMDSFVAKQILFWLGINADRPLPKLAPQTFSSWWKQQKISAVPEVLLFNDTFNEFNHPQIGIKAVGLLQAMGVNVAVSERICCGRPLISKGLLKEAKQQAEKVVDSLYPFAARGIPILGIEPSCILAIADDYKGFFGDHNAAHTVAAACMTFDSWLARELPKRPVAWHGHPQQLLLHGHCHHKALVGMEATHQVLNLVPHLQWKEVPSGCCGMAGSFGYELEHAEISQQIGELVLFPAVNSASDDTVVVADGTSCRSQLSWGTGKRARHLVEFLFDSIKEKKGT